MITVPSQLLAKKEGIERDLAAGHSLNELAEWHGVARSTMQQFVRKNITNQPARPAESGGRERDQLGGSSWLSKRHRRLTVRRAQIILELEVEDG